MTRILIVGASIAGVRTAQALRRGGFRDTITIVGEEPHHPYDRPPLSKQVLVTGIADAYPHLLDPDQAIDALDADIRLGVRATRLDPAERTVSLDTGASVSYDELVIATGGVPRALPIAIPQGVVTLRTLDDAGQLGSALRSRARLVIVGGGFIGAEVASAARNHGCDVTIVEAQAAPLAQTLGTEVGSALGQMMVAAGVNLITGASVTQISGDDKVDAVILGDGRRLPAEIVLVGIGARPATDWLSGSGLDITDGVACDERLRARGVSGVHAAGDVARWPHPLYGETLRIEHWTNAHEHAEIVAADLLGQPAPAPTLPYVWSDQFGHRIQIVGRPGAGSLARMTGDARTGLVAIYADDNGRAVGGVVTDAPRLFMAVRRAVAKREAAEAIALPVGG
jgi:NADPH-dependent 2,4-dienoyl-CoA reductase/sulfur reductase-like enzyme